MQIGNDYEKAGPCGLCSRHARANGVSKPYDSYKAHQAFQSARAAGTAYTF